MENKKYILYKSAMFILLGLWVVFIFSSSLKVGDVSSQDSGRVVNILLPLLQKMNITIDELILTKIIRKAAHFAEYFILGTLITLAFCNKNKKVSALLSTSLAVIVGALVPITDETIQAFVPGRSCEITDMLLDYTAVLTAIVIIMLIIKPLRVKWKK